MAETCDTIALQKVEYVWVEIIDFNGVTRGMLLHKEYYDQNVKKGISFPRAGPTFACDGRIIFGTGLIEEYDFDDVFIYPDVSTIKQLPWKPKIASVLVDLRIKARDPNSELLKFDPRNICNSQLRKLNDMGMKHYGALEYEFYVIDKVTKASVNSTVTFASTLSTLWCEELIIEIMDTMNKLDIPPEAFHGEFGPTQIEITMKPAFGIMCPDNAIRFKNLVKELTMKHGYIATFMSKPFSDVSGSSGHFNHSVWSTDGKNNLFYDKFNPGKLSELGEQWLAGLRYHFKALAALFCPTTNCYRRQQPDNMCPVSNAWGNDNRTVGFRVKNFDHSQTYIENRIPGAASNPYLVTAACVAAGMDGIKKKMKLNTKAFLGNAAIDKSGENEFAPQSLEEALQHFSSSELIKEEFGEEFIKAFVAVKKDEIHQMAAAYSEGNLDNWFMDFYGMVV